MTNSESKNLPQQTPNQQLQAMLEQSAAMSLRFDVETAKLINASISRNTVNAYRSSLKQFAHWNTLSNPFQDQHVAQYLSYLHVSRRLAPASISLAFSAIKRLAKCRGISSDWKFSTETLAGIHRVGKDRGRGRSTPLVYMDFITLLNTCDQPRVHTRKQETVQQAKERALIDRVIISLLFMAGMRRSEVANLRWGDIRDKTNNNRLIVEVRSTKSIQERSPDYRQLKAGAADAVHRLWEARQPMTEDFVIPLTCRQIANRFQACCKHANLRGNLTAHSGRIGLARELITRGASTESVALAGGWKSERMVSQYSQQARVEDGVVERYF